MHVACEQTSIFPYKFVNLPFYFEVIKSPILRKELENPPQNVEWSEFLPDIVSNHN